MCGEKFVRENNTALITPVVCLKTNVVRKYTWVQTNRLSLKRKLLGSHKLRRGWHQEVFTGPTQLKDWSFLTIKAADVVGFCLLPLVSHAIWEDTFRLLLLHGKIP